MGMDPFAALGMDFLSGPPRFGPGGHHHHHNMHHGLPGPGLGHPDHHHRGGQGAALREAVAGAGRLPMSMLFSARNFDENDYEALLALDEGNTNRCEDHDCSLRIMNQAGSAGMECRVTRRIAWATHNDHQSITQEGSQEERRGAHDGRDPDGARRWARRPQHHLHDLLGGCVRGRGAAQAQVLALLPQDLHRQVAANEGRLPHLRVRAGLTRHDVIKSGAICVWLYVPFWWSLSLVWSSCVYDLMLQGQGQVEVCCECDLSGPAPYAGHDVADSVLLVGTAVGSSAPRFGDGLEQVLESARQIVTTCRRPEP